jgi:DNA-binding MarR family transcriptional regulator
MGQLAKIERGAHLIGAYLEPTVSVLGISQGEAHVLAQLEHRGPTAIAVLHHEFGHKRSTLTNVLDRLEQRKLVRRKLNPDDRRSFVVHLTASGQRAAARVARALGELERELASRVDDRDLIGNDAVIHALETIVKPSNSS